MVRRSSALALAGVLISAGSAIAQQPYLQVGAGVGGGAHYVDASSDGGAFLVGAAALGLDLGRAGVRLDARAFDTESEPLLNVGLALSLDLIQSPVVDLYVLGAGGLGAFLEEGDPGSYVGLGAGTRTHGPVRVFAELRYDRLVGTFTYAERSRDLVSGVLGIRFGGR